MPLRTLVQVSDLHFCDATGRDREFWDRVRELLSRWPHFSGLLGHDLRALDALDSALAGIREERENAGLAEPELIVTGDLTAMGHDDEFAIASEFLSAPSTPTRPALGVADWRRRAVPGNHDHWPGRLLWFGSPTTGLVDTFPPEPTSGGTVLRWSIRDGGPIGPSRRLVFLLLDGDADIPDWGSLDRVRAIGDCDRAARELEDALADPKWRDLENQVRVLLLHHSMAYRGRFLELDARSRNAVSGLVHRAKVSVVLTGHIHRAMLALTRSDETSGAHTVLEARSPTTTQLVETGRKPVALTEVQEPQGFLVHTADLDGDVVVWTSELWTRSRREGFRPTGSTAVVRIRPWATRA